MSRVSTERARVSGKTAASEEAEKQAEDMVEPFVESLPEEREQWFRSPGFQRMRTAWNGPDAQQMQRISGIIDDLVFTAFSDAYAVMSDLYDLVRDPEVDPATGEVRTDSSGFPIWRKTISGAYVEDWTALTVRQKEDFLYRITTSLFLWTQKSVDLWVEAMMAKAIFTENFSMAYDSPMTGTIEDRNAVGNIKAAEDRYFALFTSAVSKRADAVVRSMELLSQRLKDTLS